MDGRVGHGKPRRSWRRHALNRWRRWRGRYGFRVPPPQRKNQKIKHAGAEREILAVPVSESGARGNEWRMWRYVRRPVGIYDPDLMVHLPESQLGESQKKYD